MEKVIALALLALSGCGLTSPDPGSGSDRDPAQDACEAQGGDYFCTGIGPDGEPVCQCIPSAA